MFVALAIASLVIYVAVRSNLHDQIDVSLFQSAQDVALEVGAPRTHRSASGKPSRKRVAGGGLAAAKPTAPRARLRQRRVDLLSGDPESGQAHRRSWFSNAHAQRPSQQPNGFVALIGQDALVARGVLPPYFRDVPYHGTAIAVYTMHLPSSSDGLVRTARPLTEANATVARVRWLLIALTLGGALAASLLGRLAANAVRRAPCVHSPARC